VVKVLECVIASNLAHEHGNVSFITAFFIRKHFELCKNVDNIVMASSTFSTYVTPDRVSGI